jgi:phosphatidylserine/phosphatidylglycerophosphate/cardiolipin synthase-like enzyme
MRRDPLVRIAILAVIVAVGAAALLLASLRLAAATEPLAGPLGILDTGGAEHHVILLDVGDDALLARIHLIRMARRSIDLQTYIWRGDATSRYLFRELLSAAARGVEVRILVDQIGSSLDPVLLAQKDAAADNLAFKLYNPTYGHAAPTTRMVVRKATRRFFDVNQRMHSKLFLVDGRAGIVGGRNVEDTYFDRGVEHNFKDRDALVFGPSVAAMQRSFDAFWDYAGSVPVEALVDAGLHRQGSAPLPPPDDRERDPAFRLDAMDAAAGDAAVVHARLAAHAHAVAGPVVFYADPPGKGPAADGELPDTAAGLRTLALSAERSVMMQTPYLFFSGRTMRNLRFLRRARPDLRLLASSNSLAAADHFFVYAISFKQKRAIVEALGFEVYELRPHPADMASMTHGVLPAAPAPGAPPPPRLIIHAKALVVDDAIAWIGSHNFEPRSQRFNTEVAIALWDPGVAADLAADIRRDMAPQNSWVIGPRRQIPVLSWISGLIARVSRASTFLDVWPFGHMTSYELREGAEPVPPGHPDFRRRYRDVGQFPGTDANSRRLQTRIMSAMGGVATPLM